MTIYVAFIIKKKKIRHFEILQISSDNEKAVSLIRVQIKKNIKE